jgi:hypothetical protein
LSCLSLLTLPHSLALFAQPTLASRMLLAARTLRGRTSSAPTTNTKHQPEHKITSETQTRDELHILKAREKHAHFYQHCSTAHRIRIAPLSANRNCTPRSHRPYPLCVATLTLLSTSEEKKKTRELGTTSQILRLRKTNKNPKSEAYKNKNPPT